MDTVLRRPKRLPRRLVAMALAIGVATLALVAGNTKTALANETPGTYTNYKFPESVNHMSAVTFRTTVNVDPGKAGRAYWATQFGFPGKADGAYTGMQANGPGKIRLFLILGVERH